MAKIAIIFLLLAQIASSQTQELNYSSMKVVGAYQRLAISRNDSILQLNYIEAFPQNWKEFLSVFQPRDLSQLYPKYMKYIELLDSIRSKHPVAIGNLLINLATKAKWEADATGKIQHMLASYSASHTIMFAELLNAKTQSEMENVVTFIADVESYASYSEYQEIIDSLKTIKEINLSEQFEKARQLRMKEVH